jgi:hypothetical protein
MASIHDPNTMAAHDETDTRKAGALHRAAHFFVRRAHAVHPLLVVPMIAIGAWALAAGLAGGDGASQQPPAPFRPDLQGPRSLGPVARSVAPTATASATPSSDAGNAAPLVVSGPSPLRDAAPGPRSEAGNRADAGQSPHGTLAPVTKAGQAPHFGMAPVASVPPPAHVAAKPAGAPPSQAVATPVPPSSPHSLAIRPRIVPAPPVVQFGRPGPARLAPRVLVRR